MMSQLLLIVTISMLLHSSSSSSLNDSLTVLVGCVQEANHRSSGSQKRMVMAVFAEAFSTPLTCFNNYAITSHHGRFRSSRHHSHQSRCPSASSSLSCFNAISGATSSRQSSFLHNRNQATLSRNYFHSAATTIIANGHTSRILQQQKAATSSVTSLSLAMKATTTARMDNLDATSISSSTAATSTTSTDGASTSGANSNSNNQANSNNNNNNQNSWLDRTTARLLDTPTTSTSQHNSEQQPQLHIPTTTTTTNNTTTTPPTLPPLTPDDVNLITTLMTSHARRSTIESARICEQLLKRVVEEVNRGNEDVGVTTKMYTVGEFDLLF